MSEHRDAASAREARVLIGYDGSECADRAVDLVASLGLAPGTPVRLVTAVPDERILRGAWGALIVGGADAIVADLRARAEAALDGPRARLAEAGLAAEGVVSTGRAPQVLTAEASAAGAALVVVGSRGLGPIASAVMGSVSSEVVDTAPCPALVARGGSVERILLAVDGSEGARAAEEVLLTLPIATRVPVSVVSVVDRFVPWTAVGTPLGSYPQGVALLEAHEAERRAFHEEVAGAAVRRLVERGVDARPDVRSGEPATELIEAAGDAGCLVVMGSRGRTGIARLVLGSVARRVLNHASASVLVVRQAGG